MKAALIVLGVLLLLVLLRRPLGGVVRLTARSGLWLGFLWLFRSITPLLGVTLGVNLFNAVLLGVLGVPGLALMMMVQWLAK
jgi:inhibitor of the pro-sigma K processing machinery